MMLCECKTGVNMTKISIKDLTTKINNNFQDDWYTYNRFAKNCYLL